MFLSEGVDRNPAAAVTSMASLLDVMHLVDEYTSYLEGRGVNFDQNGFPLLEPSSFLQEWPSMLVPYERRRSKLIRREMSVICFFCKDELIYPRLTRVLDELSEYRAFMGAVATDITVTADMDPEWQAAIMLLNQLFMAVLAVNGIKVVANSRSGSQDSAKYLRAIPAGASWAMGSLGCNRLSSEWDFGCAAKMLSLRPSMVMVYGKRDEIMERQLMNMGLNIRRYSDYHVLSNKASRMRRAG